MDELQLARDRYGNLMFNVYKISQGVGRARGRKTGGIETTPTWRLCCITSGETPLTTISDGAGAYARIIDVRIDEIIFDLEDGQRITKTIRNNYGHAGRIFVEKLIEIGDEELERRYGEMVKQINNSDKIQEKQRMAAAGDLIDASHKLQHGDEKDADVSIAHDSRVVRENADECVAAERKSAAHDSRAKHALDH